MARLPSLALAALLALLTRAADAQTPRAPHPCFRGAPGNRCTWFPLVEAGIHRRLTDRSPDDEHILINWSLGLMVNQGPQSAIGGALFASLEGEFRAGAALRWRRWLSPETSFELGAGVHLAGEVPAGSVRAGSPTVQARLNYGDLFTGTARLDVLQIQSNGLCDPNYCPYGPGGRRARLYLGAELGSYSAAVGYGFTGVLFILALLAPRSSYAI